MRYALIILMFCLSLRADTLSWTATGLSKQWLVMWSDAWQPSVPTINDTLKGAGLAAMLLRNGAFSNTNLVIDIRNFTPAYASDAGPWQPLAVTTAQSFAVQPPADVEPHRTSYYITPLESIMVGWVPSQNADGYVVCCWSSFGTNYVRTASTNAVFDGLLGGVQYKVTCMATNQFTASLQSPPLYAILPWISVSNTISK